MNSVAVTRTAARLKPTIGLGFWMERVLEECNSASVEFAAEPVHDLRVAMRRCRSMADGLMTIDPDKSWKAMKKAGKPLFQALGELRDAQVMEEVVQSLAPANDPVVVSVLSYVRLREQDLKAKALAALEDFDRKAWRSWSRELPRRASRIRRGSAVFKHLALERWTEARELQRQAFRNRSQAGLHRLRIGLKRFRYTVENFLPELHDAWIADLKSLQDMLGEVHDFDVLWAKIVELHAFPDDDARERWRVIVNDARNKRIEKYRERMLGNQSLWSVWRAELPQGKQVRAAGLERLRIWASLLDPNVQHSRHVARLALRLFDGLVMCKLRQTPADENARDVLHAAALMHAAGGGRKKAFKLISELQPPLGWSAEELTMAGVVARYHRGALPQSRHKQFSALGIDQRKTGLHLAAVLRLACAFDADCSGSIQDVQVRDCGRFLVIHARGYSARSALAEGVACSRHLLELVYGRPVMVRAWR